MSSGGASAVGTGVGSFFGAYGSLIQGKQTSDLLNNQANMQRRNAAEVLAQAKFNSDRSSMMATKHMGAMTAAYAASGVDSTSGSVLSVMGASAANSELDRLNILHGGQLKSVNYQNQASLDELGAKHSIQAAYFNALSSLIGGGAKMYADSMSGGKKKSSEPDSLASGDSVTSDMDGSGSASSTV